VTGIIIYYYTISCLNCLEQQSLSVNQELPTIGRKNHSQIQTGQKFQGQLEDNPIKSAKYGSSQYMWSQIKTMAAYPAVSISGCVREIYQ
jgi:hypothetical protein